MIFGPLVLGFSSFIPFKSSRLNLNHPDETTLSITGRSSAWFPSEIIEFVEI